VPRKKALPKDPSFELQRDLLIHPETNPTKYVAFEDADQHVFVPDPEAWSRVNAWWLADASWIAYAHDTSEVRRVFRDRARLPSCEVIDRSGTECYVAHNDTFAIVTFRGTQPDDWADLFEISRFVPAKWDVGRVHEGFADALEPVWSTLDAIVRGLPAGCKAWFTGHSLGAALATLGAIRCGDRAAGLCTFGSPRIGDGAFAAHVDQMFGERSLRYANDHDVVTHVPPPAFAAPGRYTHVNELRWINKDGQVGTTQPTLSHFVPDVFGDTRLLLDVVDILTQNQRIGIPDALADHTPLYYALHTWNDFAVNEQPVVVGV
jgi:triacylglycerol lipase